MNALAAGTVLPSLVVRPTLRQLVRYAGASGDFYEMHYDPEYAAALGHRELAVHGLLKAALLGRVVTRWLGDRGRLVTFEVSYRGMDFRNEELICGGYVSSVDNRRARLELWIEAADGRRTTLGAAEIELAT